MNQIARYRKAIVHVIGVAVTAYLARYGDALWPIVTAWVLSTLGVSGVSNRLSLNDIWWQPNFRRAIQPYLSISGTYGSTSPVPPISLDVPSTYSTTVTADPDDCTNAACPIHHPKSDVGNP